MTVTDDPPIRLLTDSTPALWLVIVESLPSVALHLRYVQRWEDLGRALVAELIRDLRLEI